MTSPSKYPCSIDGCDKFAFRGGMCSGHNHRMQRHGDPLGGGRARIVGNHTKRFESYFTKGDPDECWEWEGSLSRGYGQFRVNSKGAADKASRYSYELYVGPIPEGHVVRHKCDNPPCVNPLHLETGTQADNVQDMMMRGRHSQVKHSREQVAIIRHELDAAEPKMDAEIGLIAGVPRAFVYAVKTGSARNWDRGEAA